ncbi:MAG TPA: TIGR03854 family LLM class F420-dependent oxidoreductase [Streptosporangiaceae bacterium]|nr:TIGR03854 family LLM class F420-dependent oxidoreductase [Streptosporangiaceae bacterium]
MKVRIGISLGPYATPEGLAAAVGPLEEAGVDSLWLSEVVYGDLVEPLVGMTYALARTSRLKVGTGVAVLPGRHPVLVAKELASLAALAPRRVLPVFGLRPARGPEAAAFPVPGGRAAVFDESLELLRQLLTQPSVTFSGQFFTVTEASVGPLPVKPLDIWLGGSAPEGLRRVGRFGDGWLGSFLTPAEAGAARQQIEASAAAAGREIEADHYGISLAVGEVTPEFARSVQRRRPGVDPASLLPGTWAELRGRIEAYVDAGLSKFVVRPATPAVGGSLERFIDAFVAELLPLES